MSDLARKLGLAPGRSICLLDAPPDAEAIARAACPPGATLTVADGGIDGAAREAARYDVILFWPRTLDGLTERLAALQWRIVPDGVLWIVMPKQAHARARGVTFAWDEMQAAALRTDLVDNKVASFSETDYATRFVIRKERRAVYT
ncbi:MAG TPA: hypothetical protein VIG30_08940 [Ktedonobacterales bacterium]